MTIVNPNRYRYQLVPASSVALPLGTNGGRGDYLHRLIIDVTAAATASVTLNDGATVIPIMTSLANQAVGPISLEMNIVSRNAGFTITTGAGCSAVAVGIAGT